VLPRIITGTATGALIAALVGVHDERELLGFLNGEAIDPGAFAALSQDGGSTAHASQMQRSLLTTLIQSLKRLSEQGVNLDVNALEACLRVNVGDLTFAEAHEKTKRVLNITVSSVSDGIPNLLNYLTAPNVLIWSAALVSNIPDAAQTSIPLYYKGESGQILPWSSAQEPAFRSSTHAKYSSEREGPLARIAELFNVNHFIVSQARPYIAPFLRSDLSSPKPRYAGRTGLTSAALKVLFMEVQHRLRQLDTFGYLPRSIRRLLLDDHIPGTSLTLVPEVGLTDYLSLLRNPTKQSIDYWILKGERSVWPAIGALKIRCAVEVELDRGYQLVRRRKPFDAASTVLHFPEPEQQEQQRARKRRRLRAASMGAE